MTLAIDSAILLGSLAALVLFADKLVDASVRLARALGIGNAAIGLTLLAYGTSLPEFSVSTISSAGGHASLSVSNVIGSNIFNIAVILGLVAVISKVRVTEARFIKRDAGVMLFATLLLVLFSYLGGISRLAGVFMAFLLVLYTYSVLKEERDKHNLRDRSVLRLREYAIVLSGLAGVLVSGRYVVDSAANVARLLGVSEWIIGATIVAAGTSLPELAVSIMSARKGEFGLSAGNIIGSSTFNILWVLGFAAALNPLPIIFGFVWVDLLILAAITAFLTYCLFRKRITRMEGSLYVLAYLAYLSYLVHW